MLEEMTAIIRKKRFIGPEIWSAAYANPETRGTGGPRSWIEEELAKFDNEKLGVMAAEVTVEMIAFANGPLNVEDNTAWCLAHGGRQLMIAIVTAGVIAIECSRYGHFTPQLVSA